MNRPYPRPRRRRRFERLPPTVQSPSVASLWHCVGFALDEDAARVSRRWPVSASLLESRIGTVVSHDELRNARCFQELVATRRRIVEGASVVAIISSEGNTNELLHRLPPQTAVLYANDGASLPRSIPAHRLVVCAHCHATYEMRPSEKLVTCVCHSTAFCSEQCKKQAKGSHSCEPMLQVAHSVVRKLSLTAGWPLVSVVDAHSARVIHTISIGSAIGYGHLLCTSLGASLQTNHERRFVSENMALVAKLVSAFVETQETCLASRALKCKMNSR